MNERHRQAKRVQKDCAALYLLLLMHRRGRPSSRTPLTAPRPCHGAAVGHYAGGLGTAAHLSAPLTGGASAVQRGWQACAARRAAPGPAHAVMQPCFCSRACTERAPAWQSPASAPIFMPQSSRMISPAGPTMLALTLSERAQPAARGGGARVRGPPGRPAAVCSALPPAQRGAPGRPRRRRRAARRVRRRPGRARRRVRGRGRARAAPGERCAARAAAPRGACPAMREV